MRFDLQNKQPDNSYDLQVTAETIEDVVRMQKVMRVFNLNKASDALAYAEALQKVQLRRTLDHHVLPASVSMKGALEPYAKELIRLTSHNPVLWDLDLTRLFGGLHHHYITTRVWTSAGNVLADGYGIVWEKRKPVVRMEVERKMEDYLLEKLGWRKHEPEFRETVGGLYKHNPDYATVRHKAEPGLGSAELWDLIFDHWRKNFATPGQREVLDKADALAKGYEGHDYALRPALEHNNGGVYGRQLMIADSKGNIDWKGDGTVIVRHVSWEEFKQL